MLETRKSVLNAHFTMLKLWWWENGSEIWDWHPIPCIQTYICMLNVIIIYATHTKIPKEMKYICISLDKINYFSSSSSFFLLFKKRSINKLTAISWVSFMPAYILIFFMLYSRQHKLMLDKSFYTFFFSGNIYSSAG